MNKNNKINIDNIEVQQELLSYSQLDKSLECPVILFANIDDFTFDNDKMFNQLFDFEKDRASRFKVEQAKKTYILVHFLNQYFLKSFHFKPNEKILYKNGEHGKPYLENRPRLCFNISHSQNMVALAYFNHEVGVDIEYIKLNQEQIELVSQQYFSASENINIKSNPELFYKYWTKKESVLKAIGCGLTDEITKIETSFESQKLILKEDIFANFDNKNLFINSCKINDYFLSICMVVPFKKIKMVKVTENDIT